VGCINQKRALTSEIKEERRLEGVRLQVILAQETWTTGPEGKVWQTLVQSRKRTCYNILRPKRWEEGTRRSAKLAEQNSGARPKYERATSISLERGQSQEVLRRKLRGSGRRGETMLDRSFISLGGKIKGRQYLTSRNEGGT